MVQTLSNMMDVPGHLMQVTCTHRTNTKYPNFSSIFAGFATGWANSNFSQLDPSEESQPKQNIQPLNVLLLCLDSVSQQAFQRFLPNTTRFLRNELHAAFFEKHTILGDGTPPGNASIASIYYIDVLHFKHCALSVHLYLIERFANFSITLQEMGGGDL